MGSKCDYWFADDIKYGLSVVTQPTAEPVSVDEVKDNARIDGTEEDLWIERKIKAVRELAEVYTKRTFVTTTLRLTLDYFPSVEFYLPRPKLQTVTSLKYYDNDGTQQTLGASNDIVDAYTEPGRITPAYNVSWPSARQQAKSIEVIYVAGYGDPGDVPQSIKDAIIVGVTQFYEYRGDEGEKPMSQLPEASKALLMSQSWGFLG
jgi:uncharacterized phiE125 gp8 family phage protein